MKYKVYLISDAEQDLLELYKYVTKYDSPEKAEHLLEQLEPACHSLSDFAHRGHTPPELEHIGVFEYKEIQYKPYRILYQIIESNVFIHCVLDGRRDLQELLEKRLLR